MKKIGILFLTAALALGALAACAGDPPPEKEEPGPEDPVYTYEEVTTSPDYAEVDVSDYTTYYFDSEGGSDSASGLSEGEAKSSLSAANDLIQTVKEGQPVRILFKAGSVWSGKLALGGFTATKEKPLIVGAYGQTETEPYARIDGSHVAVEINAGKLRVSGLEVTARTGRNGIYINLTSAGALTDLVISDNYIHDVNFRYDGEEDVTSFDLSRDDVEEICPDSTYTYGHGAIVLETNTSDFIGPSWCEDVWIENNKIERVSRVGMFLGSNWARRPGMNWGYNHYYDDDTNYYPHRRMVIRGNELNAVGGDGIVLLAARDSYIENNTCYYAQLLGRPNFWNAGIWTHSCRYTVIQYNEAAYTQKDNGAGDGQGFDIDIGNSDVIFRYNYSHDNEGGGILFCNTSSNEPVYDENGEAVVDDIGLPLIEKRFSEWDRNVVSNNVFADNDGQLITSNGKINGLVFVQNTVVLSGDKSYEQIIKTQDFNNSGVKGGGWLLANNLFVSRGNEYTYFNMSFLDSFEFRNNIFYGFSEEFYAQDAVEGGYVDIDPQVSLPEKAADGMEGAYAFAAQAAAVYTGGIDIDVRYKLDYASQNAENIDYIGAFCKAIDR